MTKRDRVFVAGHRGLVGSALVRGLRARGYANIVTRTHQELDLTRQELTEEFFRNEKPDVVILAAAKVGGIVANNTQAGDFIQQNLAIQSNVIGSACKTGAHRLIFLGSSCIYPKLCSQPMEESSLLTAALEPTNRAYAIAKIAGLELVDGLRRQYGCDYFSAMPTNLYGPNDNYDLENSHVLPALIRKILTAAKMDRPEVVVWGSGMPLREFLHADDCADAILFLLEQLSCEELERSWLGQQKISYINIGTDDEIAIKELAEIVASIVGYRGRLRFDTSRPDGTPRKRLSSRFIRELGWSPKISLHDGISSVIRSLEERGTVQSWVQHID